MTSVEPKLPRVSDTRLVSRRDFAAQVTSLTTAVLRSVETIGQGCLQPVAPANAGLAYQPKTLLALLTYAYALGIYASSDIETMMRADINFRELCGHEFPRWKLLRRFRRSNIDAVRSCLAQTLKIILKSDRNHNVCSGVVRSEWMRLGERQGESCDELLIDAEVNDRLERAIWIDSMAMDD
jgi:hypothetical protein